MKPDPAKIQSSAIDLLKHLIAIPSFSREEDRTASALEDFFRVWKIPSDRVGNNVWVKNQFYDPAKPTFLLNSHHDTVKPNPAYTRDPFSPGTEEGRLYGLGSNDAGGPLVSLIAAFLYFQGQSGLKYNLILAASAEEEVSGTNGIELLWPHLPKVDFAIVGEPTQNDLAIAEKGLLVLDCVSKGKAGHAAREEGVNAIYEAMKDIEWFRTAEFPKVSDVLGKVKMSVTMIQAGQSHNQIPPECRFAVDIRVTDAYSLEEVLEVVKKKVACEVVPRSMRLKPSGISMAHPLVKAGLKLGKRIYGSPTTSDQALIPVPSIKMGPGDSARSHSADEFIYVEEIRAGIDTYIRLIENL
jgi:acetylornithine deacetylase